MLSDRINGLPISRVDAPSINSFDEHNAVISINRQGNILSFEPARRNSGETVNRDRADVTTGLSANTSTSTGPQTNGLHGKPIAYNLPGATAEIERRRAELAAMARAAEARAREAEEKCEEAESRLKRELKERLLAEQRLKALEENRLRQLQTMEIGLAQAATQGLVRAEARPNDAEEQAGAAESKIEALSQALTEAEAARAKAEALAQAATDKARRLESEAETAKNALAEANRKIAEAEAAARAAEEKTRKLIEAENAARQAIERYQTLEVELQREVKQRALAEQKLKEYEDELGAYLQLDWSRSEPDMALIGAGRAEGASNGLLSQLQAQIDVERRARQEAEAARAALELKMWDMEKALRIAEENNRQIAALNLNMAQSVEGGNTYTLKKQKNFKQEFKFIVYGMAIMLMVVALFVIIGALFARS